jgi:hypothetical protein
MGGGHGRAVLHRSQPYPQVSVMDLN